MEDNELVNYFSIFSIHTLPFHQLILNPQKQNIHVYEWFVHFPNHGQFITYFLFIITSMHIWVLHGFSDFLPENGSPAYLYLNFSRLLNFISR